MYFNTSVLKLVICFASGRAQGRRNVNVMLWLWLEQCWCCRSSESSGAGKCCSNFAALSMPVWVLQWDWSGPKQLDCCKIKVGLSQERSLVFSKFTQLCFLSLRAFTWTSQGSWWETEGGYLMWFWGAGPCCLFAACSQPTFCLRRAVQ